jgi:hypothetical protein
VLAITGASDGIGAEVARAAAVSYSTPSPMNWAGPRTPWP